MGKGAGGRVSPYPFGQLARHRCLFYQDLTCPLLSLALVDTHDKGARGVMGRRKSFPSPLVLPHHTRQLIRDSRG